MGFAEAPTQTTAHPPAHCAPSLLFKPAVSGALSCVREEGREDEENVDPQKTLASPQLPPCSQSSPFAQGPHASGEASRPVDIPRGGLEVHRAYQRVWTMGGESSLSGSETVAAPETGRAEEAESALRAEQGSGARADGDMTIGREVEEAKGAVEGGVLSCPTKEVELPLASPSLPLSSPSLPLASHSLPLASRGEEHRISPSDESLPPTSVKEATASPAIVPVRLSFSPRPTPGAPSPARTEYDGDDVVMGEALTPAPRAAHRLKACGGTFQEAAASLPPIVADERSASELATGPASELATGLASEIATGPASGIATDAASELGDRGGVAPSEPERERASSAEPTASSGAEARALVGAEAATARASSSPGQAAAKHTPSMLERGKGLVAELLAVTSVFRNSAEKRASAARPFRTPPTAAEPARLPPSRLSSGSDAARGATAVSKGAETTRRLSAAPTPSVLFKEDIARLLRVRLLLRGGECCMEEGVAWKRVLRGEGCCGK